MEQELDARRILCPLPVIRTQDAVAKLSPGDVLRVIATWCKVHGHKVLDIEEGREEIRLTIEVGG